MKKKVTCSSFIQFTQPVWKIISVKDNAYFIRVKGKTQLLKLNQRLQIVQLLNLPVFKKSEDWDISISPDEQYYCLTFEGRIEVRRLDHKLVFSKDGYFFQGCGTESLFLDNNHLVFLDFKQEDKKYYGRLNELNLSTLEVKEGVYFEEEDGTYSLFYDETHQQIFIDIAYGQDGIVLLQIDRSNIATQAPKELDLGCDKIFSGWHPSQKYFLATPHYNEALFIYTYPNIELFQTIEDEKLFTPDFALSEEEHIDFYAAFIGDDYILLVSTCNYLILLKWTEDTYKCCRLILSHFKESQHGGISYGNVLWMKAIKDGFLVVYSNGILEKYNSRVLDVIF